MNDFTKDELELIQHKLSYLTFSEFKGCGSLYLKIQSMIDNYCEHEWRCFDDQYNTRECMKCNEMRTGEINDNQ